MKDIGIYIHIPFCKRKCYYCDFISYCNKDEFVEQYIKTVIKEIKEANLSQYNIKTIYIGGGTPSYINYEWILKILEAINYTKQTEVTIEVNPGTTDIKKLQAYYNAGINRISIGLQATQNKLLKEIGRIHTYKEFEECYKQARNIGFKNINIDIMLGLPTQTIKDLNQTLEKVINLNPEHISMYSLIIEENTYLYKKIINNELELPSEETERTMYWNIKNKLENSGYIHYEISNFSKMGYESKHNVACWNQEEYIGFGVAAHSYLNNIRYSNVEKIEEYISKQKHIIHEKQNEYTKMQEYMMLGLRKILGVDKENFKRKFKKELNKVFEKEIEELKKEQLIIEEDEKIKLTAKGLDLGNLVWEKFV